MIQKERRVPIPILQLEALMRRLPPNYLRRELLEEQLSKRNAGYRGERSIDYYLCQLPFKDFQLFYDVRLMHEDRHFQIDTLLISRHFMIILEVKNIAGTLFFDSVFSQMVRTFNEKEEGFKNPLQQIKRQEAQFKAWLEARQLLKCPIHSFVVISQPNTIIKSSGNSRAISEKVIHSDNILDKIASLQKRNLEAKFSEKDVKKLSRLLLKENTQLIPDILKQTSLSAAELRLGVHCPECNAFPMHRVHSKWQCPSCGSFSKTAHIQALNDYYLLIGREITNQDCRRFLQMSSSAQVNRILKSLNLEYEGEKRWRKYHLRLNR